MAQSVDSTFQTFAKDVVVAILVLAGLYGLAGSVQFQLLQIPGYLLIAGFGMIEYIFGFAGSFYYLLFGVYILGLGMIGAAVSTFLRKQSRMAELPWWRISLAGALTVVGGISILFGVVFLVGTSQLSPVITTSTTGFVMLVLAGWLAGLHGKDTIHK